MRPTSITLALGGRQLQNLGTGSPLNGGPTPDPIAGGFGQLLRYPGQEVAVT